MSTREQHGSGANAAADGRVLDDALLSRGSRQQTTAGINRAKILIGVGVVATLLGAYGILSWTGALTTITDGPTLERYVVQLGILGPLAVIGLLATAIVLNPIPSAPIALAAGAAYGHLWGTMYVVIGAEVGALIAFAIARLVGYEVLHRWLGKRLSLGALASQNALMAAVFASRLLPFISFDLVSYAAGLTPLASWRFAVATLAGIVPASFLLAHFGGEMASVDARRITLAVLALGAVTLLPIAGKVLLDRYRKKPADRSSES
ncbi:MAG: VTT domain-containing protein [Bradyrhizobium sp.]|uniref:TVP38/TMEM64 family protein n=1 Tax=Bradyrhizobium sp. TaxID=376 RepID=UPI0029BB5699|nr:VTT domain-containing protein [Bradyrhizobium sp.]MDX3966917.1 VTT domain-containing protein [Bradyrhizobium sp.]